MNLITACSNHGMRPISEKILNVTRAILLKFRPSHASSQFILRKGL